MRRITALFLAGLLALCLCACGDTAATGEEVRASNPQGADSSMTAEPFDLDAYKVKASSFRNDTYNACVILSNMGVYENNHWKALGRLSDTIVDSAYEWLSENSDESKSTVEAAYESICAAYKDLILTDFGDNTEAKEIDSGVRSLFDGYSDLYTSVLNPSGSRDHFATHISELIDEIKSANSNLLIFLPEDEPQN